MKSVDGKAIASTYVTKVPRFLLASSFFYSNTVIVLAACFKKTGGFALY
jgi:hypothetical protein